MFVIMIIGGKIYRLYLRRKYENSNYRNHRQYGQLLYVGFELKSRVRR